MQKVESCDGVGGTDVPGVEGLGSDEKIEVARVVDAMNESSKESSLSDRDSRGSSKLMAGDNGNEGEGADGGNGCGRVLCQ